MLCRLFVYLLGCSYCVFGLFCMYGHIWASVKPLALCCHVARDVPSTALLFCGLGRVTGCIPVTLAIFRGLPIKLECVRVFCVCSVNRK